MRLAYQRPYFGRHLIPVNNGARVSIRTGLLTVALSSNNSAEVYRYRVNKALIGALPNPLLPFCLRPDKLGEREGGDCLAACDKIYIVCGGV